MKILIVEDDSRKSDAVRKALEAKYLLSGELDITEASALSNAIRVLSVQRFDLIVLDLMVPYLPEGEASSRAGIELLRQIRSEQNPNRFSALIGLSAFPDEVASARASFEALGVIVLNYDDNDAWSEALLRVVDDVASRMGNNLEIDFVIICALEEERDGFSHTTAIKISESVVNGLNVHFISFDGPKPLSGVVVKLSGMGLVAATYEAASALNVFKTKVVCMTGICAGFVKNSAIGQLVVASPAWEYQAGKWSEFGFEIAPLQIQITPRSHALIEQITRRDDFLDYLEIGLPRSMVRPPRQHPPILKPFATGSAVISDRKRLGHIVKQHRKIAALDMETYGVYFAAQQSSDRGLEYFSVKCVVDFADADKSDAVHDYGSAVSARAAEYFIRELLSET